MEKNRIVPTRAGRVLVSNGMLLVKLVWQEGALGSAALLVHQTHP